MTGIIWYETNQNSPGSVAERKVVRRLQSIVDLGSNCCKHLKVIKIDHSKGKNDHE